MMTAEHLMMITEHRYFAGRHERRRLSCYSREELAAQRETGQKRLEGLNHHQHVDILTAVNQGHPPDARGGPHVRIRGRRPDLPGHRARPQHGTNKMTSGTNKMTSGTPKIGSKRHGRRSNRPRRIADNINGINSSGSHSLGTMPKLMRGHSGSPVEKAEDAGKPQRRSPLLLILMMEPDQMTRMRNLRL